MSCFFGHKFQEAARRFVPSLVGSGFKGKLTLDQVEKALHGFTVVELRCERCGELKFTEVLGDQTK